MNWQAPLAHRYADTSHGSHAAPEHLDSLVSPQVTHSDRDILIDCYTHRFIEQENGKLLGLEPDEGSRNESLAFNEIIRTIQERIFDFAADSHTNKLYLRASNNVIVEESETSRRYTTLVRLTDNDQHHFVLTQSGLHVLGSSERPAYTAVSLIGGKNQMNGGYVFEPIISQDVFDALCYGHPLHLPYYHDDIPIPLQVLIDATYQDPKVQECFGVDACHELNEIEIISNTPLHCRIQIGRESFHVTFRYDSGFIQTDTSFKGAERGILTSVRYGRIAQRRSEQALTDKFLESIKSRTRSADYRFISTLKMKNKMRHLFEEAIGTKEVFPETLSISNLHHRYSKHVVFYEHQRAAKWRMLVSMSDHRHRNYLPSAFGLHRIHTQALAQVDYLVDTKEVVIQPLIDESSFAKEIEAFRGTVHLGKAAFLQEFPYFYGRILEELHDQGHLFDPFDLEDIQLVSPGNRQDVATVSLQFEGRSFETQIRLPRDHYEPVIEFDDLSLKE